MSYVLARRKGRQALLLGTPDNQPDGILADVMMQLRAGEVLGDRLVREWPLGLSDVSGEEAEALLERRAEEEKEEAEG